MYRRGKRQNRRKERTVPTDGLEVGGYDYNPPEALILAARQAPGSSNRKGTTRKGPIPSRSQPELFKRIPVGEGISETSVSETASIDLSDYVDPIPGLNRDILNLLGHYFSPYDLSWCDSFALVCKATYVVTNSSLFWMDRAVALGFSVARLKEFMELRSSTLRPFLKSCLAWRDKPTKLGPEMITIPDTNEVTPIEIISDLVTTIRIHGKCIYSSWPDCQGSCGQCYFSLKERGEVLALEDFRQFRAILNEGLISPDLNLEIQLLPILRLFAGGKYYARVIHKVIFSDIYPLSEDVHEYYPYNFCYYGEQLYVTDKFPFPGDKSFPLKTVAQYGMDDERVKYYEDAIRSGRRPLCLVLADSAYVPSTLDYFKKHHLPLSVSWLLDGHHKLQAYSNLDVLPSVLRIEFVGSREGTTAKQHLRQLEELEFAHDAVYVFSEYGMKRRGDRFELGKKWWEYELSEGEEQEIREKVKGDGPGGWRWFRSKAGEGS
jgi:hypothetical protein